MTGEWAVKELDDYKLTSCFVVGNDETMKLTHHCCMSCMVTYTPVTLATKAHESKSKSEVKSKKQKMNAHGT